MPSFGGLFLFRGVRVAETPIDSIHDAIQNTQAPKDGDILVGWVVVAEWANFDGSKRLCKIGSSDSRTWVLDGYLHHALFAQRWEKGE